MAGLVVKLGLGETRGSYVKPGNSGSTVWSIQTLANFSKLVLKFNMHYDVGQWPRLCQWETTLEKKGLSDKDVRC